MLRRIAPRLPKHWLRLLALLVLIPVASARSMAEPGASEPNKIRLWPEGIQVPHGQQAGDSSSLTIYLPATDKANGAAMLICPGGGYGGLAIQPEGHGIAKWLNQHGIAGIVLEYRLPRGRSGVPLADALRAIRTIRQNAKAWHVDPKRVGVIGFSAGGHLASTLATHYDAAHVAPADAVDKLSARPDFMVLVYPVISMGPKGHAGSRKNLLGTQPAAADIEEFSNELHVSAETPPTFLAHAANDVPVPPDNSRMFYEALREHKVPGEYLELPSGGHGLDRYQGPMWDAWQKKSLEWLASLGFIPGEDAGGSEP